MNWRALGRTLRLAFLLRVPLLTLLILAGLGPVAMGSSLLGNLLDQGEDRWYMFTVSFSAFLLAFTAVTTINLILHYGNDRLDEGAVLGLSQKRPLLTFLCGCAAAATLDVYVYRRTIPRESVQLLYLVLGALAAFALVVVAKVVQLALTDPASTPHPPPFLVFPAYLIGPVEHRLDDIYCWSSHRSKAIKNGFNRASQWPLKILQNAGQGYLVDLDPKADCLRLRSGHVFAASLFSAAFLFYIGIGIFKSNITDQNANVPALAFILLFLIVSCWTLSALTFFFDRYRFPLLWTIFALSAITAWSPISDHFFRVERLTTRMPEALTAAQYLKTKASSSQRRFIFVATPGGGIQAAAWTAEVLTQLDKESPGFRQSVALVSSVSGGSLGAIVYGASFAKKITADEVIENARRSAIDEVAWGWFVPDVWRVVLPWFRRNPTLDRGWALEKKWAAVNRLDDIGGSRGVMLSEWAGLARQGKMPALLINSMLVERGQPIVFSTTRFPQQRTQSNPILNFYDLYPERSGFYDIRVNTAARLSASFPYVAPASRPDLDLPYGEGFHIVDGGYYDNFGITSLLSWLNEALGDREVHDMLTDVLILQIRHFKSDQLGSGSTPGWAFQLFAPLKALFNMRDFAQDAVARNQLEYFGKFYGDHQVRVWKTSIDYAASTPVCSDPPLSWKLDQDQRQCIDTAWQYVRQGQGPALKCVDTYLKGSDPSPYCGRAAYGSE